MNQAETIEGIRIKKLKSNWVVDTQCALPLRSRTRFPTKQDALDHVKGLLLQVKEHGTKSVLTATQQADAIAAYGRLREANRSEITLTEAVAFFCDHNSITDKKLNQIIPEFCEFKQNQKHLRPEYVNSLHRHYTRVANAFGERTLGSITQPEMFGFFEGLDLASSYSKHSQFRYIRNLWNWCREKGYIKVNIFERLKAPHLEPLHPYILKHQEALTLLKTCKEHFPYFLPYVTLGLFCGVRPREIQRLKWKDINQGDMVIQISTDVAKKHKPRNVPIPLNAQLILKDYLDNVEYQDRFVLDMPRLGLPRHDAKPGNLVNFDRRFKEVTEAAGWKEWPQNCIRHSYASYLYRVTGEDGILVIDRMGHVGFQTLFKYYLQQIATRGLSLEYFLITLDPKDTLKLEDKISKTVKKQDWIGTLKTLNLSRH